MRAPRKYVLPPGSIFHFMWRCINGEFMLQSDVVKRRYLDTRVRFLKRASGKVRFHSFCLLDNHGHESATLVDDSKHMSNWARSSHSSFGRWLNIRLKRRGPVAQDRPNTVAVEDQEGLKRVMFYGDWNPVRAGICDHPSKHRFSSYRYYAFGEVNGWTSHLTPPQWYVDLADTPEERQALYRELCDQYYRDEMLPEKEEVENGCAFGSSRFMDHRERFLRGVMARIRDGSIPRRTLDRWVMNHLARQVPKTCGESRPPP